MNEFFLIAGMAAATMATRIPLLVLLSRRKLPESISRALKHVAPAVLAAIILPIVLLPDGKLSVQINNAPLAASLVAGLVSWRTRNLLLTILLGMAALLVMRALLPL